MEIKPEETIYRRTKDPDKVRKYKLRMEDISIGQLKIEINSLQDDLKGIARKKEKPDQETLEFWNAFAVVPAEPIEEMIKEKRRLLDKLTAAK